MSTKNIKENMLKAKKTPINGLQHDELYPIAGESLTQYFMHSTFSTATNVKPGQSTNVNIKFNSTEYENEKDWFVYFQMDTVNSTDHITLLNDCYSLISNVELEINDGSERLKYDESFKIQIQRSIDIKENMEDKSISEYRAKSMDYDWNGLTGVQVTDANSIPFYFNLLSIFPYFRNHSMKDFINNMMLKITFAASPTSFTDGVLIGKSNTTSNPYTVANISFSNIKFMRVFDIIKDPSVVRLYLPSEKKQFLQSILIPFPKYTEYVYNNISWNTPQTDGVNFGLQDKIKEVNIQSLIVWVRDIGTAYNDANALKKFSGYNYIKWSLSEQDGTRKSLDFTKNNTDYSSTELTRLLRNYEIEFQKNQYGKSLPLSVYTFSDDMNKYLLTCTEIPFNNIKITDQAYDVISRLNSNQKYYNVNLECNGAISANCDLIIVAKSYEMYKFNPNMQLVKVPY